MSKSISLVVFNSKDYGEGAEGFKKALEAKMVTFPSVDTIGYSPMYNVQNMAYAVADMFKSKEDITIGTYDSEGDVFVSLDDMDEAVNHPEICTDWDDIEGGHACGLAYRKWQDELDKGKPDPTEVVFVCFKYSEHLLEYTAEDFQRMYLTEKESGAVQQFRFKAKDVTSASIDLMVTGVKQTLTSLGQPDEIIIGIIDEDADIFLEIDVVKSVMGDDILKSFSQPRPVQKYQPDFSSKSFTPNFKLSDFCISWLGSEIDDISHGDYDTPYREIGYKELYKRTIGYISNARNCCLWSDNDPEEASTRMYLIQLEGMELLLLTNLVDLVDFLRSEKDGKMYEIDVEDNLI